MRVRVKTYNITRWEPRTLPAMVLSTRSWVRALMKGSKSGWLVFTSSKQVRRIISFEYSFFDYLKHLYEKKNFKLEKCRFI